MFQFLVKTESSTDLSEKLTAAQLLKNSQLLHNTKDY